ncbi:MAG: hypothetical protein WCB51_10810 [Candidatus Dormiibacterota bacterium]
MRWLSDRRRWALGGVFVLLVVGFVVFPAAIRSAPVVAMALLVLIAILASFIRRRGTPEPRSPGPH